MSTARFLIVKYIPDLSRNEPRNIGVIVWSPEGVTARFTAEKESALGEIDGRRLPGFVTSVSAYRQWVSYWRSMLPANGVAIPGDNARTSELPASLRMLQATSKENFQIVEGGWVGQHLPTFVLDDVADHLYDELVSTKQAEEARDLTLNDVCDKLIAFAGMKDDPNFSNDYPVPCEIKADTRETYKFSHAYANGTINRLYQRVPFSPLNHILQRTVHDAAWKFEKVTGAGIIDRTQGAALVLVNEQQREQPHIQASLKVLESVIRVINVGDTEEASREFLSLKKIAHH